MLKRIFLSICTLVLCLLAFSKAFAVLTIEITGGAGAGMPIAVVPFEWQGKNIPAVDVRQVIVSDLYRSGRFDILPVEDFLSRPRSKGEIRYKDWRLIKAEALVIGRLKELRANRLEIQLEVFDVFREKQLGVYTVEIDRTILRLRKAAHQASDRIVNALIGKSAAFDSRIAYVTVEGAASSNPVYRLMLADSDGFNPIEIVMSSDPIMSPAWSPNGHYLAYVSFEDGWAKIILQDIRSGKRMKLSEYPGMNAAPSWSPDGKKLALTLSHEGSPDIYVMDINDRRLKRLTFHSAIDTEPAWAPNGRSLVFTSDRSGVRQIYRIPAAGGKAVRLTFEGRENANPSFSSDGKYLLLVTDDGNGDQIGVFSMSDKSMRKLTSGRFDESPSFAPNDGMVLYATKRGEREVLEIVSADGRVRHALRFQQGGVRSPAWSPLNP